MLVKRLDCKLGPAVHTVAACVTLHYMCETFSDPFMEEWRTEECAVLLQQPTNNITTTKDGIRTAIAEYFSTSVFIVIKVRWMNRI